MLEVHIPSVGPEAEGPRQSPEKGHMVFQVEVLCSGRRHTVPRRYSEFHALHKRVRRRRPPTGPGPASVRPLPRPCEVGGRAPAPASATPISASVPARPIKKLYKVPDFPSKRLPNWRTRGLEQRRQGLEAYIQGILYLNQEVPKELLEFLRLRHFPTDPKASNWGTLGEFLPRESSSQQHQRPVLSFHMDPYVCTPSPEPLPNVVVNGVLQGLYSFSISPDKAQPKAACHPAPLPPMP
ncbi:PREDICTED: sorting nexin-22 isoform X1 [Rhinopithecus bieti]|uniref:sorting nexin-22 isoform X1 n=1 Tax=Rhinopithecus bieti TaxID=61621 RepID=UPI00083BCAFD|nr:PREDICTED: sorting nexin-22 isoform X1 [Rhinopithecus bieti]